MIRTCKRVCALFLLLAVLCAFPAWGAPDEQGALTAQPLAAKPGEQVRIAVQLQNPGVIGMRIFIEYDAAVLQLVKAENGEIFDDKNASFGNDYAENPFILMWDDSLRRDDITQSGMLAYLTFDVLPDAPGGQTQVQMKADKNSIFDVDLNLVPVADGSCVITVEREAPQPPANPVLTIREPSVSVLRYGWTLTLHAEIVDAPQDAVVIWRVDGDALELRDASGSSCRVRSARTGTASITATLANADGTPVTDADGKPVVCTRTLRSDAGLWQRILYFIAHTLLRRDCTIPQENAAR